MMDNTRGFDVSRPGMMGEVGNVPRRHVSPPYYKSSFSSVDDVADGNNIPRSQTAFENIREYHSIERSRNEGDGGDRYEIFGPFNPSAGAPDTKARAVYEAPTGVLSPTPIHYSALTVIDNNYGDRVNAAVKDPVSKPPSRPPSNNQMQSQSQVQNQQQGSRTTSRPPSRPNSRTVPIQRVNVPASMYPVDGYVNGVTMSMANMNMTNRSRPQVPELPLYALEDEELDRNSPLSASGFIPSSLFSPTSNQRSSGNYSSGGMMQDSVMSGSVPYAIPGMVVVDPMTGQQYIVPVEEQNMMVMPQGQYIDQPQVYPSRGIPREIQQPAMNDKKKAVRKEPKTILRSAFLERIIDDPNSVTLSDMLGHGIECCCDQYGSRRVQEVLMTCPMNDRRRLLNELLPELPALMNDVFANYVIQKMLDRGEVDEINAIVSAVRGRVLQMSFGTYSCRVVQKALEVVPMNIKVALADEIRGHVMRCVTDQNANHVVQKILEILDPESVSFVIEDLQHHVYELAFHPFGCHVMQRVLDKALPPISDAILAELERGAQGLMQDQYGNYVVQHLVAKGSEHYRTRLIHRIKGQVVPMSQHKYASNVVEKCFIHGTLAQQNYLLDDILENGSVVIMARDQYANYVLQKLLDVLDRSSKDRLIVALRNHMHVIRNYPHGRHIITKMMKMGML